ncbi:hypothetical protein KAFR_0H01040 [Kazachstania africana CBS 2517]|uniref:Protein kinase domain-containing protein n=1 Tax=Kazachstania africana (strain ATCC 22294 / BCRC 22015 / CBS 2517 / CECT 1963 / NBRC 1671 / NRRL Y-8276) TaxID=1071382 RepID=H2AYV8_KAZAF|nr:hypothetical protein KAFR_0H01040 [Kazachstania africana CBS 2517]CCF59514.1 hypothetical protein KAFR_0H01040 [Kazachstania africana CBS 2517]
MSFTNALNNNTQLLNQQQDPNESSIKNKSSSKIKNLLYSQLESFSTYLQTNRTIYESTKFSIPNRYEVVEVLGKGSYGIVCSVRDKSNSNPETLLAIKKITNIFQREILLKRAIRELKFLKFFRGHKNIINLIDLEILYSENNPQYNGLYCYQELIDYDLAKIIHSNVSLTEFHIKYFFYQILCGLKYIHSAEVIHRDLKPGNILVTLNGCLKICDFGLARGISNQFQLKQENKKTKPITNYVATRWYRAPELILSQNTYTKAIDLWAIGCILAEFYTRKPIFMGNDSIHQTFEIIKVLGFPPTHLLVKFNSLKSLNLLKNKTMTPGKKIPWSTYLPFASNDAWDLLDHLLTWEPELRYTAAEAIEHRFVQSVRTLQDEPECYNGPFNFSYEGNLDSMAKLREYLIGEVTEFKKSETI